MHESRRSRRRGRAASKDRGDRPARGATIPPHPAASDREPEGESPSRRLLWITGLALVALTTLVYLPVRGYPFIGFDDPGYVTENPHVTGGLTLAAVRWALTAGYLANWHPLTWISHLIDVQLFGLNAGAHHLVNLAFHVIDTLLLFALLARTTNAIGRSALVSALFAVHPMHVESVAWVAERKDVLSTFFWLLTSWTYVSWVREPRAWRYALVLLWFALGLASKPMVVTLPFVLLLLDVWPLRRAVVGQSPRQVWLRLVSEKLPLFGLSAVSSVITYVAQRSAGAVQSLDALPLSVRIANAILAYWNYVRKLAVPTELGLLYPYLKALSLGTVLAALVLLVLVSIAAVRSARTRPYLLTGWFWFLGTLVPVIGIVQVGKQPMADRYTYLPSIGLFIAAAWGVGELLRLHLPRQVLAAASMLVVALYSWGARRQLEHWRSGIDLWEHTIAVTDDNYLAQNNLGWDLARAGRQMEAIPHYAEAVRLNPRFDGGRTNLALALMAVGRTDEAIAQYEEALRLAPENYLVHANLGFALSRQGRLDEAIARFSEAIRMKADYVEAHNGLGLALARKGDIEGASRHYTEALRFLPSFAEAHNNLGAALASQGRLDDAVAQFTEALRLKPDYVDAYNNLGVALSTEGKYDAAVAHFRSAVRLDPNHAKAHYGLGLALQRQGQISEAASEFSTVLRLRPADEDARRALEQLRQ